MLTSESIALEPAYMEVELAELRAEWLVVLS